MRFAIAMLLLLSAAAALALNDRGEIGWDQRPGTSLPLQLQFRDETGRSVRLQRYFGSQPVIVILAWYSCSQLCPQVMGGVHEALQQSGLKAGRDYQVVAVSFDPTDSPRQAAQRKAQFFPDIAQRDAVHFLAADSDAGRRLAEATGFRYISAGTAFGHAAGFVIATPGGQISRYFFGVRFPAAEVRAAVTAAGSGSIGELANRLLLLCQHLVTPGSHSTQALMMLRIGVVVVSLGIGFFVYRAVRRPAP
jgi:protein SCO1/2